MEKKINEIVLFETKDKLVTLQVSLENDMVWLSANQMAVLFDKTLFVGDSTCAEFPNGVKDKDRAGVLADKIRSTGAVTCVEGHWQPVETTDTLADLLA
jgi:hypothetical protein